MWNCTTCQVDNTCVICQDCYRASDHVGHDVFYYVAQMDGSGCCDCGAPAAWSPAGFCTRHGQRDEHADPRAVLPPGVADDARAVLGDAIARRVVLAGKLAAEVVSARAVGAGAPGDKAIQRHEIAGASGATTKPPLGCGACERPRRRR